MTMNSLFVVGEIAVSTAASTAVAASVSFEPLWTALITFGVSLVTIVGGEIIKYCAAYFKNKRNKLEDEDKEVK